MNGWTSITGFKLLFNRWNNNYFFLKIPNLSQNRRMETSYINISRRKYISLYKWHIALCSFHVTASSFRFLNNLCFKKADLFFIVWQALLASFPHWPLNLLMIKKCSSSQATEWCSLLSLPPLSCDYFEVTKYHRHSNNPIQPHRDMFLWDKGET